MKNLFTSNFNRRDVGTYIRRAVAFTAGFIVILGLLSYYYDVRIRRRTIFHRKNKLFQHRTSPVDVIFLGDSRPMMDLRHTELPAEYLNMATEGEDYLESLLKLRWMLSRGASPSCLVLQVDSHMFSGPPGDPDPSLRTVPISGFNNTLRLYRASGLSSIKTYTQYYAPVFDPKGRDRLGRVMFSDGLRALGIRETSREKIMDEHGDVHYHGFKRTLIQRKWHRYSGEQRRTLARQRIRSLHGQIPVTNDNKRAFRKIMSLAESRDIKVVFIRYPVSNPMRQLRNNRSTGELNQYLNQWSARDKIDYSDQFKDHPEYFHNVDHLNDRGARVMSRTLGQDLRRLTN